MSDLVGNPEDQVFSRWGSGKLGGLVVEYQTRGVRDPGLATCLRHVMSMSRTLKGFTLELSQLRSTVGSN